MSTEQWLCPQCGEAVESDLARCWNCGTSEDGTVDPDFEPAVVSIQDLHSCKKCDYVLRGLAYDTCPECGEPFDRAAKDTAPEKPIDSHNPILRLRRVWLRLWWMSWGGGLAALVVYGFGEFESSGLNSAFEFVILVCTVLAILSPLTFWYWMTRAIDPDEESSRTP